MVRANSGPREHLDYDQIDFKIRSKTVKDYAKLKMDPYFYNFRLWKRKPNNCLRSFMCKKLFEPNDIAGSSDVK